MAERLSLHQEVLHWLRCRVGERLDRFGEAAVAAVPPSAGMTLLGLGMIDFDVLEDAILARWGVSMTLGASTDTVTAVASAIVAAMASKEPAHE